MIYACPPEGEKTKRRKDESEKTKAKRRKRKDEKTKANRRKRKDEKTKAKRRKDEKTKAKRRKDESEKTKKTKAKRRKDESEKTKRRKRKDESEKTLNSGLHVFVISLFRLRYFVMSPSLFRYVAFVISSFRLFAFVFSSFRFRLFVMAPSLCRREITKRRNGTNQPPYYSTCSNLTRHKKKHTEGLDLHRCGLFGHDNFNTVKHFLFARTLYSRKFASIHKRENKVLAKIFQCKDYRTRYWRIAKNKASWIKPGLCSRENKVTRK